MSYWCDKHSQYKPCSMCQMEALRSVATASADAEKGFREYVNRKGGLGAAYDKQMPWESISHSKILAFAEEVFLAGHAARQGEVEELRRRVTVGAEKIAALEAEKAQTHLASLQKDTDLDAMCGEVERCWQEMERGRKNFEVNFLREDRPPRVSAILAERKEGTT